MFAASVGGAPLGESPSACNTWCRSWVAKIQRYRQNESKWYRSRMMKICIFNIFQHYSTVSTGKFHFFLPFSLPCLLQHVFPWHQDVLKAHPKCQEQRKWAAHLHLMQETAPSFHSGPSESSMISNDIWWFILVKYTDQYRSLQIEIYRILWYVH